jgi:hypothetical protein
MAFAGTIRVAMESGMECGSPLESALRHHRQLWHIDRYSETDARNYIDFYPC